MEIARRPATPYVAKLLGLNLIRGRAHDGDVAVEGGGTLHVADRSLAGDVLVAVRPNAISVHTTQPEGSARNVWDGVVESAEPLGDRIRLTVTGAPTVLVDITAGAVSELHVEPGDRAAWLSWRRRPSSRCTPASAAASRRAVAGPDGARRRSRVVDARVQLTFIVPRDARGSWVGRRARGSRLWSGPSRKDPRQVAAVLGVGVDVGRRRGAVGGGLRGRGERVGGGRATDERRLDGRGADRRRPHVGERDARLGDGAALDPQGRRRADDGPRLRRAGLR